MKVDYNPYESRYMKKSEPILIKSNPIWNPFYTVFIIFTNQKIGNNR